MREVKRQKLSMKDRREIEKMRKTLGMRPLGVREERWHIAKTLFEAQQFEPRLAV